MDHTGKNCMSWGHFQPSSVIHILVRNKLIFHVVFLEEDDKKIIVVRCVSHVPSSLRLPTSTMNPQNWKMQL